MIEYFNLIAKDFQPKHSFAGSSAEDLGSWKKNLLTDIKEFLGPMPNPAELNAEVIWEIKEDGLIKRKIIFDSETHMSVPALVFIPEKALKNPAPAILCNHGHGNFAKDSVMGIQSGNTNARNAEIDCFNYDYGLQMAKHGYVTMAIDYRCFGERSDSFCEFDDPKIAKNPFPGRDICNVHFIRGSIMGINTLTLDIFDAMRALDHLTSLDCVDAERIGAMGLSFGGTMTTWISLMDERIKAADIICYSCTFKNFAVRNANFCGSQIVPGLFSLCDVPELHGLIAPKPLLAEIGINDKCFLVEDSLLCKEQVEKIYKAAGVDQNYEVDLFNGDHRFSGNKAFDFFDKHLKNRKI